MRCKIKLYGFAALIASIPFWSAVAPAHAQAQKPNIVIIMGDDIGWSNIGVYNQGIMSGRTPNLDQLASEGMRFTDYYAEASCTAGRANFITGELPIRTGLTTVGQAGSPIGIPEEAPTIANDWPILTNLRLDPYERTGMPNGAAGSLAYYNWFAYQFWRFQFVQKEVGKVAQTAIEFPPMQKGASFNLEAVKAQIEKAMAAQTGQ
jgi:arylsulfatase